MKHNSLYSKSWLFGLLIGAIAFTSCQKDDLHKFKDKGGRFGNPLVFVAGSESNGVNRVATCWIDGQEVTLSDGTNDAIANSIFVAGNEAYIAGYDGGPVYWKNKTKINLPTKSGGNANSIYESGGHVYVAGNDGSSAVYWKDGTEINLNITNAKGNFPSSAAYSFFISGNDIYVAGEHGPNAVYWKNGVEVYLSSILSDLFGVAERANSIYVAGSNVYVVGEEDAAGPPAPIAKYWKNGIEETATLDRSNFDFISALNSVFVSDNKVYISGRGINSDLSSTPAYWDNGNVTLLPTNGKGFGFTTINIYVKGNDVYVAGDDGNRAVYWKNGTEVYLTDGTKNAAATSIFIK